MQVFDPTRETLDALDTGGYIVRSHIAQADDDADGGAEHYERWRAHVRAERVGNGRVSFACPFCFTMYKNGGVPRRNAKHAMHKMPATRGASVGNHGHMPATELCRMTMKHPDFDGFEVHVTTRTAGYTWYDTVNDYE